jgi:hypothetical protein
MPASERVTSAFVGSSCTARRILCFAFGRTVGADPYSASAM